MTDYKTEVTQDLYNAALVTAGAVVVSMTSKKLLGQSLAAPASLKETAKLVVAVALSSFAVSMAKEKGFIPKKL